MTRTARFALAATAAGAIAALLVAGAPAGLNLLLVALALAAAAAVGGGSAQRVPSGARRVFDAAVGGLPRATGGQVLVLGRALLLTGALLTIFVGMLFAAGDRAFAQLAGDVLPDDLPIDDVPLQLVCSGS